MMLLSVVAALSLLAIPAAFGFIQLREFSRERKQR